jgi:prepilin-type N-terminal cleavage/methylation domain-containing protein
VRVLAPIHAKTQREFTLSIFKAYEMMIQRKQNGFSLIELLVVVAIIGVLAAAGLYGYMKYMDSVRESMMDSSRKEFMNLLEAEMARPSNGVDHKNCFELIDAAITVSNRGMQNVYGLQTPVWVNAHRELAGQQTTPGFSSFAAILVYPCHQVTKWWSVVAQTAHVKQDKQVLMQTQIQAFVQTHQRFNN